MNRPSTIALGILSLILPAVAAGGSREETLARYADFAKVEKWFKRNCNEVLGRECTATEKGDWLTYMMQQ